MHGLPNLNVCLCLMVTECRNCQLLKLHHKLTLINPAYWKSNLYSTLCPPKLVPTCRTVKQFILQVTNHWKTWNRKRYQVRGFKPGWNRRIFKGEKILSTPSFGGEVKPSVPCRRFAACKRSLELRGSRILGQNLSEHFSPTKGPTFRY